MENFWIKVDLGHQARYLPKSLQTHFISRTFHQCLGHSADPVSY